MTRPMDNVVVEIAPGADLTADPTTWPWVNITEWVHSPVTVTHGYRDESNTSGPEEISLAVQNDDGRFSPDNPMGPWFGALHEGTPLRVYWDTPDNERGLGYITQLPIRWRVPATTAVTQIVASGIFRQRLERGEVLQSPVRRSTQDNLNTVVAYWPMEDGSDSSEFASPIEGVAPMTFDALDDEVQPSDEGPPGSLPLPSFPPGSSYSASVPSFDPDRWIVSAIAYFPTTTSDYREVFNVHTTSLVVERWQLGFNEDGWQVQRWDPDGVVLGSATGSTTQDVAGTWLLVSLRIFSSPTTTLTYSIRVMSLDGELLAQSSNLSSGTGSAGRVSRVQLSQTFPTPEFRRIGHIAVLAPGVDDELYTPLDTASMRGYVGEGAGERFRRLCIEEGIPLRMVGTSAGMVVDATDAGGAHNDGLGQLNLTDGEADIRIELSAYPEMFDTATDNKTLALKANGLNTYYWYYSPFDNDLNLFWRNPQSSERFAFAGPVPPRLQAGLKTAFRFTLEGDLTTSTTRFWWATDINAPVSEWTQMGDPTTEARPVGFDTRTDPLNVGDRTGALIHRFQIRDGIDGTLVADVDFTDQPTGTTEFEDDTGNDWEIVPNSMVFDSIPAPGETPAMGSQILGTLTANLQDCADVDVAMYFESHGGVAFRTRHSLYGQEDALSLTPQPHMPTPPEPTRDDRHIVNDLTVQRSEGSSARVLDQSDIDKRGPLRDAVTVNVERDGQLQQQAAWRVALGTVPGMRWPSLPLRLSPHNPDLISAWLATRIGDRIDVDHDFLQIPGVDVDLLIEGWTESWDSIQWDAQLNCVPASPYAVWELEPDPGSPAEGQRLATAGATLDAAITDTATSFDVVTQSGSQPWINSTDHAGQFPFDIEIGGERMSVGAISGATSPQMFSSVTRSANGVTKSHDAGAGVQVADPYRSAL